MIPMIFVYINVQKNIVQEWIHANKTVIRQFGFHINLLITLLEKEMKICTRNA